MDKIRSHQFEYMVDTTTFVGIYRGIILPRFLRWCRISPIHSITCWLTLARQILQGYGVVLFPGAILAVAQINLEVQCGFGQGSKVPGLGRPFWACFDPAPERHPRKPWPFGALRLFRFGVSMLSVAEARNRRAHFQKQEGPQSYG